MVAAALAPPVERGMKTPLLLGLIAVLQLAAHMVYLVLALASLGLGPASDAFVAAQAVPVVLTAILATALQSAWQSRLATVDRTSGAWRQAHRNAHAQAWMVFLAASLPIGLMAPLWIDGIFGGLAPQAQRQLLGMTPVLLLASVFNGVTGVLTTAQRGRDRLLSAEVAALAATLLSLLLVTPAIDALGALGAAQVLLLRGVTAWLLLLCLLGGSWPDVQGGWRDLTAWRQMRPALAGSAVLKTAPLVDRYWTAGAPTGTLTLFSLAQSGTGAVAAVLERALCMPVAPRIARAMADRDTVTARVLYRRATGAVAAVILLLGLALLVVQPWWVWALDALLGLPAVRSGELWWLCLLLLGQTLVAAASTAVVAVFYATGDTRTPAWVGLGGFAVGVSAKSVGFLWLGAQGLALASSLYHLGHLLVLSILAERLITRHGAVAPSV
ncbi:hypothetical protein IP87_16525 [beta proteobacterium AAP121]|nr:hypothetical protein IP80_00245 [beta proteobacterium AAP65]KPF95539.1 hypothetical protein IP87_16525 [beta proteobacterium AAP121]